MAALDFESFIASESARFCEVIRGVDPGTPVPPCPDWSADDLLWHLGEVQDYWATIVRDRLTTSEQVDLIDPDRPADRQGLLDFYDHARRDLVDALAGAGEDAAEVWTWSHDHSVGFIRRRQAHEALIHRVDAEVAAGQRTPMDPGLSADGVLEVITVMYGGVPPWGAFTPDGRAVLIEATDVAQRWTVALGRFSGHDPAGDTDVDEADVHLGDDDAPTQARLSGTAADLVCWLWHRPTVGEVTLAGDDAVIETFAEVMSQPIN